MKVFYRPPRLLWFNKRVNLRNNPAKSFHIVSWVCFVLFAVVFKLLSDDSFPAPLQITLVLLGLLLPFGILVLVPPPLGGKPFRDAEPLSFPPFLLLVLACLALWLRFWDLEGLFLWPGGDEGLYGLRALQLAHHWEWRLFYYSQVPPFMIWSTALLLKALHRPLLCLWLPPAVVSAATLVAAVAAARAWGFKTQGWIFGALMGFGYFPLWLGRTCSTGVLMPFWVCMGFCWLGLYAKAQGSPQTLRAGLLGFWAGLGYLAFPSFPVVSLTLAGGLLYFAWAKQKRAVDILWFSICGFLSFFPFLWEWAQGNVGGHIESVAFWKGAAGIAGFFQTPGSYVRLLFWGGPTHGLFNPLLSALALTGWAAYGRARKIHLLAWALAWVLWMAPGFLSMNMELFRIVQIMPMVLWAAALGLQNLLEAFPPLGRVYALLPVLLAVGLMDFRQLRSPYKDNGSNPGPFRAESKSIERYRAYALLKETYDRQGPGFIFPDFAPDDSFDFSLRFAASSFNAVDEPQLAAQAQWAAVVTNLDYQPFLAPLFPGARWYNLDFDRPQEGQAALALLPLTPANRATIGKWAEGSACFRDIERAVVDAQENQPPDKTLAEALRDNRLLKDRLLVSCFWERMGDFFYNYMGHPYEKNLFALQLSVMGYPAAHLYYKMGVLFFRGGRLKEAREALEKARHAPLDLSPVDEALKLVEQKAAEDKR